MEKQGSERTDGGIEVQDGAEQACWKKPSTESGPHAGAWDSGRREEWRVGGFLAPCVEKSCRSPLCAPDDVKALGDGKGDRNETRSLDGFPELITRISIGQELSEGNWESRSFSSSSQHTGVVSFPFIGQWISLVLLIIGNGHMHAYACIHLCTWKSPLVLVGAEHDDDHGVCSMLNRVDNIYTGGSESLQMVSKLRREECVVFACDDRVGGFHGTTIGFIKEAPALGVSGFNVYHKNRLIRPFWKVTSDGSSKGNGVVGFERSSLFIRLETKLKQMLMDYWKSNCHLMGHQPPGSRVQNMQKKHPAQSPVGHAAHIQKQLPANQHIVGLTANTKKEMNLDQPINCLTANLGQDVDNVQPGNRCRTSVREELPAVQPIIGLREEHALVSWTSSGVNYEKLHPGVQNISELERKLEEAKKKCAQLSSHLEIRRKQRIFEVN
ncbi:Protein MICRORCHIDIA 1 [Vitis vinifera]|uniref:Protein MICRORCHIDIA 1 n=1 Tax=Vitis vinifera TaxID=29760 RepID=A0A438EVG4_VITVI|nr:Protein MICRORCHIDIA 1 [Vitis vinifera]